MYIIMYVTSIIATLRTLPTVTRNMYSRYSTRGKVGHLRTTRRTNIIIALNDTFYMHMGTGMNKNLYCTNIIANFH